MAIRAFDVGVSFREAVPEIGFTVNLAQQIFHLLVQFSVGSVGNVWQRSVRNWILLAAKKDHPRP
jgi:hypothetical protein